MAKPICLEENRLFSMSIDNGYELVENFNKNHCVTPKTQLIIVGTITPPQGTVNGYFYTAPRNKIYGYIDEALNTNLKELKNSLSKPNSDKNQTISEIKSILKETGIAFLDIMKSAIRVKESPYDSDIKYYSLDVDSFKNIPDSVYFICNSKLAEDGYKQICEKLGRKDNHILLSQRRAKKTEWIDNIKRNLNK